MKKESYFKTVFLLILSSIFLFSCSDSTPVINSVSACTIFEFNDEDSLPVTRISVFASTDEIQRVEEMRAVNETTGLVWNITDPRKISGNNNTTWAGYTNLVPASGSSIPMGKYNLIYKDAAERECDVSFYISYPKDFLEKKASDFPATFQSSYTENVALYTVDGSLLFYGRKKKTWTTNAIILRDYMLADSMRVCYGISNDSIICMMPKTELRQATENKNN